MKNNYRRLLITLCLIFISFTTGCFNKQWKGRVEESQEKSLRQMLTADIAKKTDCSSCIDAELTMSWQSQISNTSLNGYIQIFLPSSIKMVALNPLGQPIFAFSTDSKKFQTINALKGVYKHGRLSHFIQRFNFPDHVLNGDWGQWLTGTITFEENQLIALRQDVSSRGIWLTIEKQKGMGKVREYLLYDPTQKLLLQRVIMDPDGDEVASIHYKSWDKNHACPLPTAIEVKGISFGVTVEIEMKDIVTDLKFTKEDFYLKVPPNYLRQYYP